VVPCWPPPPFSRTGSGKSYPPGRRSADRHFNHPTDTLLAAIWIELKFAYDLHNFLFDMFPENLHVQFFFVLEIKIETAHGNTRRRGDRLGFGAVKTVLGKLAVGHHKDAFFGFNTPLLLGYPGFLFHFYHPHRFLSFTLILNSRDAVSKSGVIFMFMLT
jgi:hypothetical protein